MLEFARRAFACGTSRPANKSPTSATHPAIVPRDSHESDGYTLTTAAAAGDSKTFLIGENSGRVHVLKFNGKKLFAVVA